MSQKQNQTSAKMSTGWKTAVYKLTGVLRRSKNTQGRSKGQRLEFAQRRESKAGNSQHRVLSVRQDEASTSGSQ